MRTIKEVLAEDLIWSKDCGSQRMSWEDAMEFCRELREDGHSDWRLPTISELSSIVGYARFKPTIGPFGYWSSTTDSYYTDRAWLFDFSDGYMYYGNKSLSYYVRAVRE